MKLKIPSLLKCKSSLNATVYSSFIILISGLCLMSCDFTETDPDKKQAESVEVPENVLMQVSFESKTTTYSKLAEETDTGEFEEDTKHFVMTLAVPVVTKDKQVFRIYKDGTYELVIEILNPEFNPAREAFRDETEIPAWELQKLVITDQAIAGYSFSGALILLEANTGTTYFDTLVKKIMRDDYFASHVNIGNALLKVSAGAENILNPRLRAFFISPAAELNHQDGFLIVKERAVDALKHWKISSENTDNEEPPQQDDPNGPGDGGYEAYRQTMPEIDKDNPPSLEETYKMIKTQNDKWTAQKKVEDIKTYTAVDTTKAEFSAEVTYAGDQQVLGITFFEANNDPQKTIKTKYTEDYETNPVYDLDLINVESTVYSNVQIVNKKKTTKDEN